MRGMYTCRAAGPKLIPRRAGRPEKERRKGEGKEGRGEGKRSEGGKEGGKELEGGRREGGLSQVQRVCSCK